MSHLRSVQLQSKAEPQLQSGEPSFAEAAQHETHRIATPLNYQAHLTSSISLSSLPILDSRLSPTCPRQIHGVHPPLLQALPPSPVLCANPPVPTRGPMHVTLKVGKPRVVPGMTHAVGVPLLLLPPVKRAKPRSVHSTAGSLVGGIWTDGQQTATSVATTWWTSVQSRWNARQRALP